MLVNKKLLFASDVACLLSCSVQTVYKYLHARVIKGYRFPGTKTWRIPEEEVVKFIKDLEKPLDV